MGTRSLPDRLQVTTDLSYYHTENSYTSIRGCMCFMFCESRSFIDVGVPHLQACTGARRGQVCETAACSGRKHALHTSEAHPECGQGKVGLLSSCSLEPSTFTRLLNFSQFLAISCKWCMCVESQLGAHASRLSLSCRIRFPEKARLVVVFRELCVRINQPTN